MDKKQERAVWDIIHHLSKSLETAVESLGAGEEVIGRYGYYADEVTLEMAVNEGQYD